MYNASFFDPFGSILTLWARCLTSNLTRSRMSESGTAIDENHQCLSLWEN